MIMNTILTIIYLLIVLVVGVFTCLHMFQTKKLVEKITCGVMLVVLLHRLFLIK